MDNATWLEDLMGRGYPHIIQAATPLPLGKIFRIEQQAFCVLRPATKEEFAAKGYVVDLKQYPYHYEIATD